MAARIEGGCLYVTKSVRIPLDCIYTINHDRYTGKTRVLTERCQTFIEESLDELRELVPDLCEEVR